MKKRLIGVGVSLLLLVGALAVALPSLGLSVRDPLSNVLVGAGMSAKLACSGRYVSGLSHTQLRADMSSYSPAIDVFSIAYDEANQCARAHLFGMAEARACYRPRLGCTLEIGDTRTLGSLRTRPAAPPPSGAWPLGEDAGPIDAALQRTLAQRLAHDNQLGRESRAFAVVRRGQLVGEAYADGFSKDMPLLSWSMGKSLAAVMLGHLEMRGELSTSETHLFPEWQDDARRSIRIEDLLHMSSGLAFSEVYEPGHDVTRMMFTAHSASQVALEQPLVDTPGRRFSYSSGTTNLLMRFMVSRLGSPQAAVDMLLDGILAPLGMHHTILEPDPSGIFFASMYSYASARDWARLGQLLLARGELNGTRIVEPDWVTRATAPNASQEPRYGYQLWLNGGGGAALRWPSLPPDAYAMQGSRMQFVMIVPSHQTVIVRLGWSPGDYPIDETCSVILSTWSGSSQVLPTQQIHDP